MADGQYPTLPPITESGGAVQEKRRAWLAELIEKVDSLFEGALSDQDKLVYVNHVLKGKLLQSDMSTQALDSPAVQRGLKDILLNHAHLYESLRQQSVGPPP